MTDFPGKGLLRSSEVAEVNDADDVGERRIGWRDRIKMEFLRTAVVESGGGVLICEVQRKWGNVREGHRS